MSAAPELPSAKKPSNGPSVIPKYKDAQEAARIYFLPNFFTAGNLFFGFVAIIFCIRAHSLPAVDPNATHPIGAVSTISALIGSSIDASPSDTDVITTQSSEPGAPLQTANQLYIDAVWCILLAAFCDTLDGRLARLGGRESLFGMEFDSIADTVSFGVAPALMIFFLILGPSSQKAWGLFQRVGWLTGFIYLLCVAVRLARFNVLTHPLLPRPANSPPNKDFMGLPSPAAAGFVASLVLVMLNLHSPSVDSLAPVFLPLLLLVALLMVSNIPYPSFKHIDWQTQIRAQVFILLVILAATAYLLRLFSPAIFFLCYIFYGLIRYYRKTARRRLRKAASPEIVSIDPEDEEEEDAF